jgi:hypothetical protein
MPAEDVSAECRRLLQAFGYRWNEKSRAWESTDAGAAIRHQTVAAWTVDQARIFLTREAAKR